MNYIEIYLKLPIIYNRECCPNGSLKQHFCGNGIIVSHYGAQIMASIEEISSGMELQDNHISDIVNRYHHLNELTKRLQNQNT